MNKRIVNFVDFIRTQTNAADRDLIYPIKSEIAVNKKYGIKCTFLLQYDAIVKKEFNEIFLNEAKDAEIGVLLEMSKTLIEACGIKWRGTQKMEWHVNPAFLEAYAQAERKLIIDKIFADFKGVFGYYPRVAGAWILDAFSLGFMCEKYGMDAFCNCREQYGVDAYTLWGGYYAGGYYPSQNNALCPAKKANGKIDAPIFRMLAADPIYNYYDKAHGGVGYKPKNHEQKFGAYTLEPVWASGYTPESVDWFLKTYFFNPVLNYAHLTTGQENGFGWENYGKGYILQAEKISELNVKGVVTETLGETGRNFKKAYSVTPPTALVATEDPAGNGVKSAWYNSVNYRTNLFLFGGKLSFRDVMKFDEGYKERYLDTPCTEWSAVYDNLPVMDERFWVKNGSRCALSLDNPVCDAEFSCEGNSLVCNVNLSGGGCGTVVCDEGRVTVTGCGAVSYLTDGAAAEITYSGGGFDYRYNGYGYSVKVIGKVEKMQGGYRITPINNRIILILD